MKMTKKSIIEIKKSISGVTENNLNILVELDCELTDLDYRVGTADEIIGWSTAWKSSARASIVLFVAQWVPGMHAVHKHKCRQAHLHTYLK